MLKLTDVGKKLKIDLILMIIESLFIAFLGSLFSYGLINNKAIIYILVPLAACFQTFLLEKEIFKYWNNENEIIYTYHLSIASTFVLSIVFTFLFFNYNLILNIISILFVTLISTTLFFRYYKGYVECLAHQLKIQNEKTKGDQR